MDKRSSDKNALHQSTVTAGGNVHIGDINVNHLYRKEVSAPRLLTNKIPFSKGLGHDLMEETIPYPEEVLQIINDFFNNKEILVLMIIGPNESGKTHLLREILLMAQDHYQWICNPIDSLPSGYNSINTGTELYFLDDIDWNEKNPLLEVLSFISSGENRKLILTLHNSWYAEIEKEIEKIKGLPGSTKDIRLKPWNFENLSKILRLASGTAHVTHESEIINQFPNPYLLKVLGEAKRKDPLSDAQTISKNFAQKIKRVFEKCLMPALKTNQVQDFVCDLIFNGILRHELPLLADKLDLEVSRLQNLIDQLSDADMVKSIRGSWQISPEVKGYFYLAFLFENQKEKKIKELLDPHIENNELNTIKKVVETVRYLSNDAKIRVANCLKQYVETWKKDLNQEKEPPRSSKVLAATEILSIEQNYGIDSITDTVCSFVLLSYYKFTSTEVSKPQLPNRKINDFSLHHFIQSISTNDFITFLNKLVTIHRKRDIYLSLLEQVWLSVSGNNNTTELNELVKRAFLPLAEYQSAASRAICISYAGKWLLNSENHQLRRLAVLALQTILGWSYQIIQNTDFSTVFVTKRLPRDASVVSFRSEAISLILEALKKEHLLLDCLEIIGAPIQGSSHDSEAVKIFKAQPQIRLEVEQFIHILGDMLGQSDHYLVQKEAELILLQWWMGGFSEDIFIWLNRFIRTPKYLLYSCIADTFYLIDDFETISSKAPETDRYIWYWELVAQSRRDVTGNKPYEKLVKILSKEYNSALKIAKLIQETYDDMTDWSKNGKIIENAWLYNLNRIIEYWTQMKPERFHEILTKEELGSLVPIEIRTVIEIKLVECGQFRVEAIVQLLLSKIAMLDHSETKELISLIKLHQHPKKDAWILQMIEQGSEGLLTHLASQLDYIYDYKKEIDKIASSLLQIIQSGKITQERFFGRGYNGRNSAYTYSRLTERQVSITPIIDESLQKATFEFIKQMSGLDGRENDVLDYCIRSADDLIALMDYRINQYDHIKSLPITDFKIRNVIPELAFSTPKWTALFPDAESHRRFVDKIQVWDDSWWPHWKSAILALKDPETGVLWMSLHIQHYLQEGNLEKLTEYVSYLPNEESYIPLVLAVWESILPVKEDQEMMRMMLAWAEEQDQSFSIVPRGYNPLDYPKDIWSKVLNNHSLSIQMKVLADQVMEIISEKWKFESENFLY